MRNIPQRSHRHHVAHAVANQRPPGSRPGESMGVVPKAIRSPQLHIHKPVRRLIVRYQRRPPHRHAMCRHDVIKQGPFPHLEWGRRDDPHPQAVRRHLLQILRGREIGPHFLQRLRHFLRAFQRVQSHSNTPFTRQPSSGLFLPAAHHQRMPDLNHRNTGRERFPSREYSPLLDAPPPTAIKFCSALPLRRDLW